MRNGYQNAAATADVVALTALAIVLYLLKRDGVRMF